MVQFVVSIIVPIMLQDITYGTYMYESVFHSPPYPSAHVNGQFLPNVHAYGYCIRNLDTARNIRKVSRRNGKWISLWCLDFTGLTTGYNRTWCSALERPRPIPQEWKEFYNNSMEYKKKEVAPYTVWTVQRPRCNGIYEL